MEDNTPFSFAREIKHSIGEETAILNSRMHWLLVSQGLLFSAIGLADNGPFSIQTNTLVISILGLFLSLTSALSFKRSEAAIHHILNSWDTYVKQHKFSYEKFPPVFCGGEDIMTDYVKYLKSEDKKKHQTNYENQVSLFYKAYFKFLESRFFGTFSQSYKVIPVVLFIMWIVIICTSIIQNVCL